MRTARLVILIICSFMPAIVPPATAGTVFSSAGLTIGSGCEMDINDGALSIAGDVTISGTLTVLSGGIALKGNWSLADTGTFSAGMGSVTFNGDNQAIMGATTFSNLIKMVTSADTLTFSGGKRTTVTNTLNLQGTSGQLLSLKSDSTAQWEIDPQGTRNIQYLDVQGSNNVSGTAMDVRGKNCQDSGNNTNWIFQYQPPTLTSFSPTEGGPSTSVIITGTNFVGATAVKIGGTAASGFLIDSDTQITAVVGTGSTGKVTVTTLDGTCTSINDFTYTPLQTGTYYVDIANGSDADDGSSAHPWKTLHHALSRINGGGTGNYVLYVMPGTYSIANGEADIAMTLTQNNVTLMGDRGTAPVIDGTGAASWSKGIEVTGSNNAIIEISVTGFSDTDEEGLRISGGTGNEIRYCSIYGNNWGIRVSEGCGNTINNCDIYNNSTHGIDIIQSMGTVVVRNKIHDNPLYGIRVESSPEISRNLIYDNTFGILVEALNENSASPTIKNNAIYEVSSGSMSYGIFTRAGNHSQANPVIYHNTIDGGTLSAIAMEKDATSYSSPIIKYDIITNFGQYGINNSGAYPTIDYNDVWNNTAENYNGCAAGANDISLDPKYGSYSLQADSPCINTIPSTEGDPVTLDYPGFKRPRPGKTTKDMGAYGYVADVTNNYTLPGGTGIATDYRIFTVPLYLGTGTDMLQAMEKVLGDYDPAYWRGFMYNGTSYNEFNSGLFADHPIKPGMGFWIITTHTDQIPFEGGPAPDGVDYEMDLEPVWHLMGLPWVSTQISLGNIMVTDGMNTYPITSLHNDLTQQCVWHYTGPSGYEKLDLSTDTLQSGTGYFFKVHSSTGVTVIFPTENRRASGKSERGSTGGEEEPPPPPGMDTQPQPFTCPDISRGRLEDKGFPSNADCQYRFNGKLTLGSGVTIKEGANVTFKPKVE